MEVAALRRRRLLCSVLEVAHGPIGRRARVVQLIPGEPG
jgi:hypothetical protein